MVLQQLHSYFDNSSVRTERMKAVCKELDIAYKKLVRHSFTRWLSHDAVVRCVKDQLPALCRLFTHEESKHDSSAQGLLKCVSEYYFIASIMLFTEILPKFARLSRIFQTASLDFSIVDEEVQTLTEYLMSLLKVLFIS